MSTVHVEHDLLELVQVVGPDGQATPTGLDAASLDARLSELF